MASKVCSSCGGRYRGSWAAHAATKGHRDRAYRLATYGTTGRRAQKDPNSKAGRKRTAYARARSLYGSRGLAEHDASKYVDVRRYRRGTPTPPNRQSSTRPVKVRRHFRKRADLWSEVKVVAGVPYRVFFDVASGAARFMRPAGRKYAP